MTIKFEYIKMLIKKRGFYLIIAFLVVRCIVTIAQNDTYQVNSVIEQNKGNYFYYLSNINGQLNESKEQFIKNSQLEIENAHSNSDAAFNKLVTGEISENNYFNICNNSKDVIEKEDAFGAINGQYFRVKESPQNRYFIYENGWILFLGKESLDFLMVILILIIVAPVFCFEDESGMSQILKSSKNGKRKLFWSKTIAILSTVILIGLLLYVTDFILYSIKYGLPDSSFPLQSLNEFSNSKYDMSIFKMVIINLANKLFGLIYLSAITITLSVFIKKSFIAIFSSVAITILPYFVYSNSNFKHIIPTPLSFLMSVGFFKGEQTESFQGDAIKAITKQNYVFVIITSIFIMALLLIIAYRKYNCTKLIHKKHLKSVCGFVLINLILFSLCSCSNDKTHNNKEFVFNSLVGDDYLMNSEILIDNTFKNFKITEIDTQKEFNMIRNPFYRVEESNYLSNIRLTDDKIYYMKGSDFDNYQIIEVDIDTFTERIVYDHIEYVEDKNNFLDIHKNTSQTMNAMKYTHTIYFVCDDNLYLFFDGKLAMVNLSNNKSEELLKDDIYQISYYNNTIYYINKKDNKIYSYDINSKSKKQLSQNMTRFLLVTKHGVFYTNLSDSGKIYRINYDGTDDNLFLDASCDSINNDEKYLYYSDIEDNKSIYRVDFNGNNVKKLTDKPAHFIYTFENSDTIYYMTDGDDKKYNSTIVFESIKKD